MVSVICKTCNKIFKKHKSTLAKNNYCSPRCYHKSLRTNVYEHLQNGITKLIIKNKKQGEIVCFIDTKNLDKVEKYSWSLERRNYVSHRGRKEYIKLHRLILDAPADLEVDHIDGNPLNNIQTNLRLCNRNQNAQNLATTNKNSTSGLRNINWLKEKNKWRVVIQVNKKRIVIGNYKLLEDAKKALAKAKIELCPFSGQP